MQGPGLFIASMKDIDCKVLVTGNFTVYPQFLKLYQNDQVIIFLNLTLFILVVFQDWKLH